MDLVREVCSAAHSIRKANGRRARLPLSGLTVAAPDAASLDAYRDLIADEVNVRSVTLTADEDRFASRQLTVVFKVAAPRLGAATPTTAAAAKKGDWELLEGGRARVGDSILEPGEFEMRVQPLDPATTRSLPGHAGLVVLDTTLTEDLVREGLARDLVRAVQQRRREIGLDVSDRIRLELAGDSDALTAVKEHRDWIAEQVLALEIIAPAEPDGATWSEATLADDVQVVMRVSRQDAR
jgi:isoleucyl-tRNA synthetase